MKKITAAIKIIRPVNFAIVISSVLVSSLICMKGEFSVFIIAFAALSAGSAASAGNIINDIFDISIDKLNRPDRPLPSGAVSKGRAIMLYIFFVMLSLILAAEVNTAALMVALSADILLFMYSFKLKSVPLIGNGVVAGMTALAFLYGGIAVNNISYAFIPAVFAFLINAIREIVKDMEDVKGDSANNIITYPVLKGYRAAKILILVLGIVLIIATFYPFINGIYSIEYFIIVMITVNPLTVVAVKKLFNDHSPESLNIISRLLKLNMIFGLAAIYLGK